MYYYKLTDGTVIDVEKIAIIDKGDRYNTIRFEDNRNSITVKVKDIDYDNQCRSVELPGAKDIKEIEDIMIFLTKKNTTYAIAN